MNIKEVHALSHNLRQFYRGSPYPYLFDQIGNQIGNHVWLLREGKITKSPYSEPLTPQELSEDLFYWVKQ